MTVAFVRSPDASIGLCELTHLVRTEINFTLLKQQHNDYVEFLTKSKVEVHYLPHLNGSSDGVFVEDTSLVLDEVAIICHPGAESRKHEIQSVHEALKQYRNDISFITAPGTADGGDLLKIEKTIYIGDSTRTNKEAFHQFSSLLRHYGYEVKLIPVKDCLHLKTGVCYLGSDTVLINSKWIDPSLFQNLRVIEVDQNEPFAANAICIGNKIIHSSGNPKTKDKLISAGFEVESLCITELSKAEAGLTCLSLIFRN